MNIIFHLSVKWIKELEAYNPTKLWLQKAIASRLKSVLSDLIEYNRTGFLKGHSIVENICLINNVISYTHSKGIPGLLLSADFEKAFDTIEWSFVRKTLEHFGFGSSFINCISLFYTNIQSCVINTGIHISFFWNYIIISIIDIISIISIIDIISIVVNLRMTLHVSENTCNDWNSILKLKNKFLWWQVQRINFSRDGAKFSRHYKKWLLTQL